MNPKDSLVEVDELVSRCRDEKTKAFLAEAVACYKAEAFRAAIVATWIAVVFDFIAKLRELDLMGEKKATMCLAQLEAIHQENDPQKAIPLSQTFERTVLDVARTDFELVSSLQYKDLLRLYEDRHRCAHPSMHSLEEPYQPTEALVLYHLENAVTFLLSRPPVQGKAAEQLIWADIHSEYFPTTVEEAMDHFMHGPLVRAREPLLRRVIVGLTKSLLNEQRPSRERQRQYAALEATLQLSYQKDDKTFQGNEILVAEFSSLVLSLPDEAWPSVISYLSRISSAWNAFDELGRRKALRFMQSCPLEIAELVMTEALTIPALKESARERLPSLSIDSLILLLSQSKQSEYIEEAIGRWGNAETFDEAKIQTRKLIIPLLPVMNGAQIARVVTLFQENDQLSHSFFVKGIMLDFFEQSRQYSDETKNAWVYFYEKSCLFFDGKLVNRDNSPSLLSLIEEAYPDVVDLATLQAQERYAQFVKQHDIGGIDAGGDYKF